MPTKQLLLNVRGAGVDNRLVYDTFEDSDSTAIHNHTPDFNPLGNPWTSHHATDISLNRWEILSNQVEMAGIGMRSAEIDVERTDLLRVSMEIRSLDDGAAASGPMVRVGGAESTIEGFTAAVLGGGTAMRLIEYPGDTIHDTVGSLTIVVGDIISIELVGNVMTGYHNGTPTVTYTTGDLAANTGVGLSGHKSISPYFKWDDFLAEIIA